MLINCCKLSPVRTHLRCFAILVPLAIITLMWAGPHTALMSPASRNDSNRTGLDRTGLVSPAASNDSDRTGLDRTGLVSPAASNDSDRTGLDRTGLTRPAASNDSPRNKTSNQLFVVGGFNNDTMQHNETTNVSRNSSDEHHNSRKPSTRHFAPVSRSSRIGNVSNRSGNVHSVTTHATQTSRPRNVSDYVTFMAGNLLDGRGVGNQLHDLAAMFYVSAATGRRPAFYTSTSRLLIFQIFELNVEFFDDLSPYHVLSDRRHMAFNSHMLDRLILSDNWSKPANDTSTFTDVRDKSLSLSGFFISWKYADPVKMRLREQLVFRQNIRSSVDRFLGDNVPPGWTDAHVSSTSSGQRASSSRGFMRVGIHVRRGDYLSPGGMDFGYTVPSAGYFQRAMRHFLLLAQNTTGRVQFIVCSNDMTWSRENIANITELPSNSTDPSDATSSPVMSDVFNITYSTLSTAGEDLALLASCDHVIQSVGTYSWWAAWLAGGTTVYYEDYPRNGSVLYVTHFEHDDVYPSNWIGMT